MGKKDKKTRVNVVPQQCRTVEAVDVVKENRSCPHFDKKIDLGKLSEKIRSMENVRCEDCRESAADRRGGKGKHGKKKNESKILWVCLECGHCACGGVGLPTTPQTHAIRHFRQTRHNIVIKLENPHLRWCFRCSTLIPVEKVEEDGQHKDMSSDVIKLIKGRSTCERPAVDTDKVFFRGEAKLAVTLSSDLLMKGGYVVKGLVNLGNTCFFNSVMQNLLAIDMLRNYFLEMDSNFGSLTISLKKFFAETKPEAGLKHAINPKSLFGCLCMSAPQFRGYQQHDAHELLRCLLDSLSVEELGAKTITRYFKDDDASSLDQDCTRSFVDDAFGGQILSSLCCMECGHTSTAREPFLDLSLPVPNKKPTIRISQPVFRGEKPKLVPKICARTQKIIVECVSSTSSVGESSLAAPPSDRTLSVSQGSENEQVVDSTGEQTSEMSDNFARIDYLEPERVLDEEDRTSENNDGLVFQDHGVLDDTPRSVIVESCSESDTQVCSLIRVPNSSVNSLEDELPLLVKDSEVTSLPYREEAESPSFAAGCEQEELEFNIGDFFDEPDVFVGPMPRPSPADDFLPSPSNAETISMAFNISEPDPDEVDDSSSPVSVESCLARYIKPERLSKENAWHCVNCSKTLSRQRLSNPVIVKNQSNGDIKSSDTLSSDGEICRLNQNFTENEVGKSDELSSEANGHLEDSHQAPSHSSLDGPCVNGNNTGEANHCDSELTTRGSEPDKVGDDEIVSKGVKVMRDATKRVLIDKAPPILTIHLKRFSQDARGCLSKLNGHVKFGKTLDLRPYMNLRCTDNGKTIYSLVGVVEHTGNMRGGHYIAYVRGGKKNGGGGSVWYHASDACVRQASLEQVLRCEAYILFYERN